MQDKPSEGTRAGWDVAGCEAFGSEWVDWFLDDDVDLRVSHPKQGAIVDVGAADNRHLWLKVKASAALLLQVPAACTSSSTTMASRLRYS